MDLKEIILETIDDDFIISLIEEFGSRLVRSGESVLIFTTICHGGNSPKLYYYKDSKSFYCYSECGALNIFNLVMQCLDCDFATGLKYLKSRLNIDSTSGSIIGLGLKTFTQLAYEKNNNELLLKQQKIQLMRLMNSKLPKMDDHILNYFDYKFYTPWEDDGYEAWALHEFGICFHHPSQSIIIPHYNEDNELVGIRRRTFDEYLKTFGKYTPLKLQGIGYAHRLGFNLYGLNMVKKTVMQNKRVIVVESEKAAIKSYQWYKGASLVVAACGFNLTSWQIHALTTRCEVKEIVLCFDCDYIGESEIKYKLWLAKVTKIAERIKEISPDVKVTFMSDDGTYLSKKENCFDKQDKRIFQIMFSKRKEIINDTM